jgi:sporulation-control protein spo0M
MVYGVVPPLIVALEADPTATDTEVGLAVKAATVAVTVIATVTVFVGDELSFTTTLVVPAATPVTDSVEPLIVAVATVEVGFVTMVYGAVPPVIVALEADPAATDTEVGLAVKAATVAVTVIATVTVFAGDELSFTITLVVPASTPVTDSVTPLIVAVATEEFGTV